MTVDEALELFAKYGNVCSNIERLRLERPTKDQLSDACMHSQIHHEVNLDEAAALIREYWGKIDA